MTTFLPRTAWTTTTAAGNTLTGTILRGVAVHWPGTTQDVIGDPGPGAIADRLRSYRSYHVNTRGWRDIGYNFAIDQAGRVWMLRSTAWKGNLVGAHCASSSNPDANREYVGVLLVIGDRETPSAAMVRAFRDWHQGRFLPGWPGRLSVRGHGKVAGAQTDCPGTRTLTLISQGAFTQPAPLTPPEDDDMFSETDAAKLAKVHQLLAREGDNGIEAFVDLMNAVTQIGRDVRALSAKVDQLTPAPPTP